MIRIEINRILRPGEPSPFHFATSEAEWRAKAAEVLRGAAGQPEASGCVRGMLVDPFDRTVTPLELVLNAPTTRPKEPHQGRPSLRVDALVDNSVVAAAIGRPHA